MTIGQQTTSVTPLRFSERHAPLVGLIAEALVFVPLAIVAGWWLSVTLFSWEGRDVVLAITAGVLLLAGLGWLIVRGRRRGVYPLWIAACLLAALPVTALFAVVSLFLAYVVECGQGTCG